MKVRRFGSIAGAVAPGADRRRLRQRRRQRRRHDRGGGHRARPRRGSGRVRRAAGSDTPVTTGDLKPVKLQLQWVTQAQFAGYYAAVDQGYYKDAGLDVEILEGGVDITPQTVLAQGNADFAIAWVPKALAVARAGRRHHRHRPDLPALRARSRCRARPTTSPTRPT